MGKSAKLHKRISKTLKKPAATTPIAVAIRGDGAQAQAKSAKSVAMKRKAARKGAGAATDKHVLGGADYVDIMMGSRKKAREEAAKLPRDQ